MIDELTVAWAIEAPMTTSTPKVLSDDGQFSLPLTKVGSTDVFAAVITLPSGSAMLWHYVLGYQKIAGGPLEVYPSHPDSLEHAGYSWTAARKSTLIR